MTMTDTNPPFHMNDPFDLNRFLTAQERDYAQALSEIQSGRKRSYRNEPDRKSLQILGIDKVTGE